MTDSSISVYELCCGDYILYSLSELSQKVRINDSQVAVHPTSYNKKSLINKITRSVDSHKLQLDLQVTKYSSYTSNEVVSRALTDFKSKTVQALYCKVHTLKSLITAVTNSLNQ